jgi:hypothetical protein
VGPLLIDGPFLVNCPEIPGRRERELLGHELLPTPGAGARSVGRFERSRPDRTDEFDARPRIDRGSESRSDHLLSRHPRH